VTSVVPEAGKTVPPPGTVSLEAEALVAVEAPDSPDEETAEALSGEGGRSAMPD
jgi:hypothetical protein